MASAAAAARQPARFVPAPPLPAGPAEVEGVNAQGAWLLPLDGSAGVMVYRWQLPPEVKDGDVVLDGRVDRQATERHHAWISQQLADLERRERRLDATGSGGPALTPR